MAEVQRRELIDRYLETQGLKKRKQDFGFLSDLVGRHVANFAFSSVGVRLGEDLPLDFESLFDRIVTQRRGGYCFEQNGLLYEILEELGFSPELYLARVIYNKDIHPGLTHRISIVEYRGQRYVLDVGFGPDGPSVPVLFSQDETQDRDRVYRVAQRNAGEYHMQVFKDGDFYSLYRFELTRYGPSDCNLGHFYSHRHPDAAFVNHLVVSLILAGETRSLRDLEYRVITQSGTKIRNIDKPELLTQVLIDDFLINVTQAEGHQLFEGLTGKSDGQAKRVGRYIK